MREIFDNEKSKFIEQGSILNHCIAENYGGYNVHGIIITPRCDIGNNKVSTIHYLPVVTFSDWLNVDFWEVFSKRIKGEIENKLNVLLRKYKQSENLLSVISSSKLIDRLADVITRNGDFEEFKNLLLERDLVLGQTPSQESISTMIKKYPKQTKNIFKDLKENKIKEFYLLENWDKNQKEYYVVLLREIRKITSTFASKVSSGIYTYNVSREEKLANDINFNVSKDAFFYSITKLCSPHIEHLIQQFFWNFARIGVDDHPKQLEESLYSTILNQN